MKSRLYLNLGIVYEGQSDLSSARKFMEKALRIVKQVTAESTFYTLNLDTDLTWSVPGNLGTQPQCFDATTVWGRCM